MTSALTIQNTVLLQQFQNTGMRTVNFTAITTSSGTTTSEAVGITTPTLTFTNGRAYKLIFTGFIRDTVAADQVAVRIRKTNASGTTYYNSIAGIYVNAANQVQPFYAETIATNTTGADLSQVLVGTFARVAGTGSVNLSAATNSINYLHVMDIGLAGNFANAVALS